MNKIFPFSLSAAIFCSINMLGQQMPIEFSDSSDNFIGFGGSSFSITSNPNDGSDMVGQFINNGNTWEGFFLDLAAPIDLDFQKEISLDFYAFDSYGHQVMLKLENGGNPNVEVVVNVPNSGWTNNIIFDFANAVLSSDGTTPVNATGTYNRLTVFVDGGSSISGTYLIDDVDDGSTPTDPHALDVIYTDLVWSDEFDMPGTNNSIDTDKWHHQTILPRDYSRFPDHDNFALCCWFNGEKQHYTDRIENSFVENGLLNIVAIKESYTDQGETKQYTSARLNSKFAFTYGRVDVRAKLPFGDGTWPAIWTLGKNIDEFGNFWHDSFGTTSWPECGEIDIMEHGLGEVNHTSSAIHTPSSFGATINYASQEISDVANNFHIYSVNWSPNQITFLVDDVGFYTYNPSTKDASTWPFDSDQYMLLNVAMGGVAGSIDPSFTQSAMQIDYVRIYQNTSLSLDSNRLNSFEVYPNPAEDLINVKSNSPIDKMALFNTLGQKVLEVYTSENINVSTLSKGMYYLKIWTTNKNGVKKIIIK